MEINEYKSKAQIQKRLREIEQETLIRERKTHRIMMEEYKSGKWSIKPRPIKEEVQNCLDCDSEIQELRSWLLGYKICENKLKERKK